MASSINRAKSKIKKTAYKQNEKFKKKMKRKKILALKNQTSELKKAILD